HDAPHRPESGRHRGRHGIPRRADVVPRPRGSRRVVSTAAGPVDVRALTDAEARDRDRTLGAVAWRELPPGVMRTEYAVPSGRLAGLVAGEPDAPRVVLVPGITGSKEDFIVMLPLLAAAGMRVETFDMAGQYESHRAGPENLRPARDRYDL